MAGTGLLAMPSTASDLTGDTGAGATSMEEAPSPKKISLRTASSLQEEKKNEKPRYDKKRGNQKPPLINIVESSNESTKN